MFKISPIQNEDLQKQYAKDCAAARVRNKKEAQITKEEAKKVNAIRVKKYALVSQLTSWIDKKKVSERSIEKAKGVKVLLNREIKEGVRVKENMDEIKQIDADIVKWEKTIITATEKRKLLEMEIKSDFLIVSIRFVLHAAVTKSR